MCTLCKHSWPSIHEIQYHCSLSGFVLESTRTTLFMGILCNWFEICLPFPSLPCFYLASTYKSLMTQNRSIFDLGNYIEEKHSFEK